QAMRKLVVRCRQVRHAKKTKSLKESGVTSLAQDGSNNLAGTFFNQESAQLMEMLRRNMLPATVPEQEENKKRLSTADFDLLQYQMQQAVDQRVTEERKNTEEKHPRQRTLSASLEVRCPTAPTMDMVKRIQNRMATSKAHRQLFRDLIVPEGSADEQQVDKKSLKENTPTPLAEEVVNNQESIEKDEQVSSATEDQQLAVTLSGEIFEEEQSAKQDELASSPELSVSRSEESNVGGDAKDNTIATLVGMLNRMDLSRNAEMDHLRELLEKATREKEQLDELLKLANEDVMKRDEAIARLIRAKEIYKKLNENSMKILDDVRDEKDLEISNLASELEAFRLDSASITVLSLILESE
ncbi:hypothetical protein PMAYCL1PPCAC_31249, partial [Pristionchus mayeri]